MRQSYLLSSFIILACSWFIFSGYNTPFFLVAGFICCVVTLVIARRMDIVDHEGHPLHLAPRAPLYWFWLIKEMIGAGVQVSSRVLTGKSSISPQFGWVHDPQKNPMSHTIYANSMTLTPGTVAVDIQEQPDGSARIYIHALEASSLEELQSNAMLRQIQRLIGRNS